MIPKLTAIFFTLTVFSLIVGNVYVSSNYTTSGIEYKQLEAQKKQLVHHNRQLEEHILNLTSIQHLQQLSHIQNYTVAENIDNIKLPSLPVALNPAP